MGADLYRKDKDVPILGFERSQKAIDVGYFRDAYNSYSILQQFGLSWWVDIAPLQNKQGVITLKKVKEFRAMLDKRQYEFDDRIEKMTKENQDYFKEGRDLLIKYLDSCIEDGASIEASL